MVIATVVFMVIATVVFMVMVIAMLTAALDGRFLVMFVANYGHSYAHGCT